LINPTERDIGRKVIYRDRSGAVVEEGVITSFHAEHVFVRYGADSTSKGTRRQDLEWVTP
jgi:hypothetical protein